MPHPIEPEERPALKSLGEEFGADVEQRPTSAGETYRSKMQSSTLSLESFWFNQRTVLKGLLTAQNDANISKIDELNRSLEKAGVGDEAFSQLLENWEHLTSPFNEEYTRPPSASPGNRFWTPSRKSGPRWIVRL